MANVSAEAGPGSRYARVKAILEAAAGSGASDYGGLGRFWDLPLDALVEAKVFDVRLIAPGAQASCCGGGESPGIRALSHYQRERVANLLARQAHAAATTSRHIAGPMP